MSVTIDGGFTRLELSRVGEPEIGYPASSYLTRVGVYSGPLSGSVESYAGNWDHFLAQLDRLNETMRGDALLNFWNEVHEIKVTGGGRGDLAFHVTVTDSQTPPALLQMKLVLDQSYLGQIIADLRQEFS